MRIKSTTIKGKIRIFNTKYIQNYHASIHVDYGTDIKCTF